MSVVAGPKVVTDGIIFSLDGANTKSYSGSGSTWEDVTGQNDGAIQNLSGNVTHTAGLSLNFNVGSELTTGYVEMGNVLTTKYTKNIWFRTTDGGTNNLMSGSSGSGGTVFWCQGGQRYITAGHSTNYNYGNNAIVQYDSGSDTGLQSWHNAVVTYESTTTTMKLYVNGKLVDTGTENAPTELSLHIGAYANQYEFCGNISQTSLYDRALTASEVLQNFIALKGRFGL